ncbi:uncharacterized protein LOC126839657 [Adelges cooleyi]|uniref:uncharacterized protein LOC126839657 n=1 Tax=Adelges cooleyi TaxID=133065 RepID=UPI00217FDD14|nr:uncharacterized protein LOC126839657 [Adelges cooleyi]
MKKNVFILFLLVLVCMHNETNASANMTEAESIMLSHVQQKQHWQRMWFNEFNAGKGNWMPVSRIWCKDSTLGALDRLRMVCPMMGCAYGIKLNWFLLLTLEAIDECDKMQRNNNDYAGDCMAELEKVIEAGSFVILKLMYTIEYIDVVIDNGVEENRFYHTLSPLDDFLTGQIPIQFSGRSPGGSVINKLFNGVAESLRNFLLSTCSPNYQLFEIKAIRDEYSAKSYPKGIYMFYVEKLYSYTDYINGHLLKLWPTSH